MIIEYTGIKIAKASYAYFLWENKKFKELDLHLAELEDKRRRLED